MSSVHHSRKIVLHLSYDAAFKLCIASIGRIERSKITKEDRPNGKIDAKGGITWKTLGDKIEFNLTSLDEGCTEVEFSSRPAIRTTLIDYGKNLQNVQTIEHFLKEHGQD